MFTFAIVERLSCNNEEKQKRNIMKKMQFTKKLAQALMIASAGLIATSCIDDSYDFSQPIDLTMGLGAEGLALKFGSTDSIYLKDILQVDNTVKLDKNNTYYLIEEGSTSTAFHVSEVNAEIDAATLSTHQRVVNFRDVLEEMGIPSGISVPVTTDFTITKHGEGETDMFEFGLKDVQEDIVKVSKVYPVEGTHIRLNLELVEPEGMNFKITKAENLEIIMPEYLVIKSVENGTFKGNVITIDNIKDFRSGSVCDILVDHLDLGEDGVVDENHELNLPSEKNVIKMKGDFTFGAASNFTMNEDDYIDVELKISITSDLSSNVNKISIEKVTGVFNPIIEPITEQLDIASELPDFLRDDRVRLTVSNPTLRFDTDLKDIPLNLGLSGQLIAKKNDDPNFAERVDLPGNNKEIIVKGGVNSRTYFYQADKPYDPTLEGEAEGEMYQIQGLSNLVKQIPDYIEVNIGGGQIHVVQDKEQTIYLGKDYNAALNYAVFVPFEFQNGLCIVYNDETESIGADLQDFQAPGVEITGKVISTLPLDVVAKAVPLDAEGKKIEGITVSEVKVLGSDGINAQETDVVLDIVLSDPALLAKVDRIKFEVKAESGEITGSRSLKSDQFLQFKDLRLKLKGQIVTNFN